MQNRLGYLFAAAWISLSSMGFATQSVYCPQNHGYIKLGMTPAEVLTNCGQPSVKQQSNRPVMQQVNVEQLIYNSQGAQRAFYNVWSIPVGNEVGVQLEVDVTNNKVSAVRMNGSNSNAFTICGGTGIQIGDPVSKVYNACGNPSLVNNTYIYQPIASTQKPEIWTYQSQFGPSLSLTFVNGTLQSIN